MMLALFPFITWAQNAVNVSIGNGTIEENYLPFNTCYKYSYSQSVYPVDSFGTTGFINSISWNCATPGTTVLDYVKIYMGTTQSVDSQQEGFLPMNRLTLVYEGTTVTIGASAGWQTFDLTTPFLYDGLENLVVVVAKQLSNSQMNCTMQYYVTEQPSSYASIISPIRISL